MTDGTVGDPTLPPELAAVLLEGLPGVPFVWVERPDGDSGYLHVGAQITRLYGVDPAELVADWTCLPVHPEDFPRWISSLKTAARTRTPWDFKGRFLLADGTTRWWRGLAGTADGPDGSVRIAGVLLDIEREETALRNLEATAARYRDLAGLATDWFWESGIDNRVTWVSDGIRAAGLTPDRLLGRRRDETGLMSPAQGAALAARLDDRQPFRDVRYELPGADGQERTLAISGLPIHDADGGFLGYRGVERDVTLEVRAEREALRAAAAADAANRAKSQLLAVMSHELRTPMTAILGGLDLLEPDMAASPQAATLVRTMRNAARGLLTILDDVLDFSRIEAGALELEDIPYDPRELLAEIADLFRGRAAENGSCLMVRGSGLDLEMVRGDPNRVRQVLVNLVGNAVKFTRDGAIILRVASWQENGRAFLHFAVADSGIGMTAEQQARIFEPFVQADQSTSRRFGGTGLGLAICRRLVTAMSGRVEVESRPGHGSVFRVTLPTEVATAAAGEATPQAPQRPLHLLLVDDNPVNRTIVSRLLENAGHRVDQAASGLAALELTEATDFDVVLMDIQMPELDGDEATRRIRARGGRFARLPIVALTANAMPEQRDAFAAVGFDAYVTKPVDWPRLQEVLGTLTAPATR